MIRIVLFGAGGRSGRANLAEARSRGHQVTAAVRNPVKHRYLIDEGVALVAADATNKNSVSEVAAGHDVAVNATRSVGEIESDYLVKLNNALLTGLTEAAVRRLLIVGGAGALVVSPGLQFVDTPAFPESAKPRGVAHREALTALLAANIEIDWVYVTPPPVFVVDGVRTGRYRLWRNNLLEIGDWKNSSISYLDYAIGIIDEIESPTHHNEAIMLAW
jgi:putative NADH-flavin reductase